MEPTPRAEVLVNKVETIREELGSVAKVIEDRATQMMGAQGMHRDSIQRMMTDLGNLSAGERQSTVEAELEDARLRQDRLREEVDRLPG